MTKDATSFAFNYQYTEDKIGSAILAFEGASIETVKKVRYAVWNSLLLMGKKYILWSNFAAGNNSGCRLVQQLGQSVGEVLLEVSGES